MEQDIAKLKAQAIEMYADLVVDLAYHQKKITSAYQNYLAAIDRQSADLQKKMSELMSERHREIFNSATAVENDTMADVPLHVVQTTPPGYLAMTQDQKDAFDAAHEKCLSREKVQIKLPAIG